MDGGILCYFVFVNVIICNSGANFYLIDFTGNAYFHNAGFDTFISTNFIQVSNILNETISELSIYGKMILKKNSIMGFFFKLSNFFFLYNFIVGSFISTEFDTVSDSQWVWGIRIFGFLVFEEVTANNAIIVKNQFQNSWFYELFCYKIIFILVIWNFMSSSGVFTIESLIMQENTASISF